ncbi:MAG: lipopolysaccharide biosynthesis protein [Acidobacteriota bacterium]|nr:MAG: lipopolysaccharide biosynthesis protein [Acidobacteriota bacterium]
MSNFRLAAWDFSGRIAIYSVAFVAGIILTRILTPEEFGAFGIVMAVIWLSLVFVNVGFKSSIIQAKEISQTQLATIFWINVALGILIFALFAAVAPLIERFYSIENLSAYIRSASVIFLITSSTLVPLGLLQREIKLKQISVINFVASVLSATIAITMALFGARVWALIAQQVSAQFAVMAGVYVASRWTPSFRFDFGSVKSLWSYGSKLLLSNLLQHAFSRLDVFVIGKIFPIQMLGYYNRARSLEGQFNDFGTSTVTSLSFPFFSRCQDDPDAMKDHFVRYLHFVSLIATSSAAGLFVVGQELVVILFSERWAVAGIYFQLLMAAGFAYPISGLMVSLISAKGKSGTLLILGVIKKAVFSLGFIAFMFGGVILFLYACIVTSVAALIINIIYVAREVDVTTRQQSAIVGGYLLVATISATVSYVFTFLFGNIYVSFLVAGAVYAGILTLLHSIFRFRATVELYGRVRSMRIFSNLRRA